MSLALAENWRTISKATIKRASNKARVAMNQLDRERLADLDRIYRHAAQDLQAAIRSYADSSGSLRLQVLQDMRQQIENRLSELGKARDRLLNQGLQQAAVLGSQPFAGAVQDSFLTRAADEAVRFVQHVVSNDGLQLSDRLWRLDRGARELVGRAVENAVIQGHSASQAANDLINSGQPVPADLAAKMNAANAERVSRLAADQLLKADNNPRANALRVMRTELNRAHGEAYMVSGEQHPDFAGWRFLLSPRHPRTDICDMHARANVYGLGPGVYPSRDRCPWPAHPNTLSYVEIVFKDEVSPADKAGKQSRIDWLKDQPATVQQSVLNSRYKRAALQQGLLTERQIATPWRVLKPRFERKGVSTDQLLPAPDPQVRGGTYDQVHSEALDYVVKKGQASGHEYAVAYDMDSLEEVTRKTSRAKDHVSFSSKEVQRFADRRRKFELVHNHPNSSSLSYPDLNFATLPGIQRIVAAGHDGTVFRAHTYASESLLKEAYQTTLRELRSRLAAYAQDAKITQEEITVLFSHAINRTLHEVQVIDYETPQVGSLLAQVLKKHRDELERAVAEVADTLKKRFSQL